MDIEELKRIYSSQKDTEYAVGEQLITYIENGVNISTENVTDVTARIREKMIRHFTIKTIPGKNSGDLFRLIHLLSLSTNSRMITAAAANTMTMIPSIVQQCVTLELIYS